MFTRTESVGLVQLGELDRLVAKPDPFPYWSEQSHSRTTKDCERCWYEMQLLEATTGTIEVKAMTFVYIWAPRSLDCQVKCERTALGGVPMCFVD